MKYKETALRYLAEMKLSNDGIRQLLPEIIDAAVDSSNLTTIGLAKNILVGYKSEAAIRDDATRIMEKYLPINDEWNYRRIAEIYELLGCKNELLDFLSLCKRNDNPEIREISDDFSRSQE